MLSEHVLVSRGLAMWYRGRLIPIMRGGDDRAELFPQIPAELTGLDDEQLAQHRDTLLARITEVTAGHRDPDIVGDLLEVDVEEQMAEAVLAVRRIKDELTARESSAAAHDAEIARLATEAGVDPDPPADPDPADPDPAADPADPDPADPDPDPVDPPATTAAATATTRRPLPAARARHRPAQQEADTRGLRLTTHAAGLGAPAEAQQTLNRKEIGEVLSDMVKKRVRPGETAVVASATYDYPPELMLDQREGPGNTEKIQTEIERIKKDHFTPKALIASGGLCAPLTPIYDLPGVETAVRPVRDALPSFQAARGGVIVGATPVMGDFAAAVGVITSEENALGGTHAIKSCLRIDCPEFQSVEVDSIFACYEMDNLRARAYPELMARVDELLRAEQARLADSRLLTTMTSAAAGATKLTGGSAAIGAVVSFLGDLYSASAQYRSSNRMASEAPLQLIIPDWLDDLLALDIASGQFDRFQSRDQIIAAIRQAGVTPVFTLDGSATATDGQVFDHATAGSLDGFPATVEWALFAPGVWLHLDSGQLDLGVVRDSTLNSTNDFQVFYETWENVVKVGGDSYAVTTTVCPSGVVAAPAAPAIACAA